MMDECKKESEGEYTPYEKRILDRYSKHTTDEVLSMLETATLALVEADSSYRKTRLSKFDDDILTYTRTIECIQFVLSETCNHDKQN